MQNFDQYAVQCFLTLREYEHLPSGVFLLDLKIVLSDVFSSCILFEDTFEPTQFGISILRIKTGIPQKIPTWLKYILAVAPIIWIFWNINLHEMAHVFKKTAWWIIPLLIGTTLLTMFLQGVRWWMLLRSFIPQIRFRRVMYYHFSGIFYSIVLPTSAAQDVVRTVLISKENDYSIAWGSTWISRILGLLALALLSLYGFFRLDRSTLPQGFFPSISVSLIILFLLFFLSFNKGLTKYARIVFRKLLPLKALLVVENIREATYKYRNKKPALLWVFLVTLCIQLILICSASLMLVCITGKFFLNECCAFIPLIEIISLSIPLTPSGMGLRELLTKAMFNHIGISDEQLGVYIILTFSGVILKLVGGIPILYNLMAKGTKK